MTRPGREVNGTEKQEVEVSPYPKPGGTNPVARLGVVSVAGGAPRWQAALRPLSSASRHDRQLRMYLQAQKEATPEYQEWKKLLHHFYDPFPKVTYYK